MKYFFAGFFYRFLELAIQTLLVIGIVFVMPIAFVITILVVAFDLCIDFIEDYIFTEDENEKETL